MTAVASGSTPRGSKRPVPGSQTQKKKKATVSHNVDAMLSSSISEDSPAGFLSSFAKISDRHYLPEPRHLQVLLYLCINPPAGVDAHYPVSILHSLRNYHTPTELSGLMPRVPRNRKQREDPAWLYWADHASPGSLKSLDKQVRKAMRGCVDGGIWELLWDDAGTNERQGISTGEDDSDLSGEEDGEEEEEKRLSDAGWDVLEWFVCLWEADEAATDLRYSQCLLDQLPPALVASTSAGPNGQQTSATAVLAVVRAAYSWAHGSPFKYPTRQVLAMRLITLLLHCTLGPSPPFSPSSFIWSLLSLFPTMDPRSLDHLLKSFASTPWTFRTHLLTLAIEDTNGSKSSKTAARKTHLSLHFGALPPDQTQCVAYPPPLLSYVLESLLPSSANSKGKEDGARLVVLKEALLREVVVHYPKSDHDWSKATGEGYMESLNIGESDTLAQLSMFMSSAGTKS